MRLIVGLGNPGSGYKDTRHNIGFMTVDKIASKTKTRFKRNFFLKSYLARSNDLLLAKPRTFMNLSGVCVKALVNRFRLGVSDVLIICDDLNLAFGRLRLRPKGSSGGHNGLSSVIEALKTEEFARLRIGIGGPKESMDASDFVLSRFSKDQEASLTQLIDRACQCALAWEKRDIERVMAEFN